MFVGIRTGRLELDELWAYVGKKQKRMRRDETEQLATNTPSLRWHRPAARSLPIAPASANTATTDDFIQDLRERIIGAPEISTDGFTLQHAIRDAFGNRVAHGRSPRPTA